MSSSSRIELALGVFVSGATLQFNFSRSGGPGGQNVNKVNSKVELRVQLEALEGISVTALARLRAAAGRRLTAKGELL
ncbi:MAG: peptide chain release factor-like protein, partial [Planctomycetota bacterium]